MLLTKGCVYIQYRPHFAEGGESALRVRVPCRVAWGQRRATRMATQMRPVPPVLPEPHARLSKVRTDLKKSSPSHMQPASVQGSLGRADWRPAKGTPPTKPGRRGPRPGSALRCAQRQRARLGKFPIASRARIFSWPRPGCALRCAQRRRLEPDSACGQCLGVGAGPEWLTMIPGGADARPGRRMVPNPVGGIRWP